MKKIFKNLLVFAVLTSVCVALAGCGDKDGKKSDKNEGNGSSISGTRYFESGNYKETIKAELDADGYASEFVITMELDDADKVEDMKSLLEQGMDLADAEVKIEDGKIIITMSAEVFLSEEGLTYENNKVSKEQIKELFEENEFTIEE